MGTLVSASSAYEKHSDPTAKCCTTSEVLRDGIKFVETIINRPNIFLYSAHAKYIIGNGLILIIHTDFQHNHFNGKLKAVSR